MIKTTRDLEAEFIDRLWLFGLEPSLETRNGINELFARVEDEADKMRWPDMIRLALQVIRNATAIDINASRHENFSILATFIAGALAQDPGATIIAQPPRGECAPVRQYKDD